MKENDIQSNENEWMTTAKAYPDYIENPRNSCLSINSILLDAKADIETYSDLSFDYEDLEQTITWCSMACARLQNFATSIHGAMEFAMSDPFTGKLVDVFHGLGDIKVEKLSVTSHGKSGFLGQNQVKFSDVLKDEIIDVVLKEKYNEYVKNQVETSYEEFIKSLIEVL